MIELQHSNGLTATVNPDGAFIESLVAADGTALLWARRTTAAGKDRGGIPLCAPIFGPGETVGLNQHGFARNCTWNIDEQTESQVKLSLDNPASQVEGLPPIYAGLGLELTVELLENGLSEILTLRNIGVEACTVNPGFHPYFPIATGELASSAKVTIDDAAYTLSAEDLIATRKIDSLNSVAQLNTIQGTWTISSENLPLFAMWSESPAHFICVEPTESGYLTDNPASELAPNETKMVSMTVRFSGAA